MKIHSMCKVFFTLICNCLFAQNNQFIYDYKFKSDSLNRNKSENETMVLETSGKGSKFYSYARFVYDSTMTSTFKQAKSTGQNHFDFSNLKNPKVKFETVKKYPEFKTTLRTEIGKTSLAIETPEKIIWKIESGKDKILGYNVQKATTNFYGRKWIAWFTPEIPIQDGPHVFSGLPGLILKIEDAKEDHSFTLIGTKKTNSDLNLDDRARYIPVNEEKFKKMWEEYKKDPAKDYRQATNSNAGFSASVTFGGKTYTENEMLKALEEEGKEKIKKENNPVELSLYK